MKTLDMLGQPCPIPVIQAKKVLADASQNGVVVIVDNMVAVQNLQKMAKGMGYGFSQLQQSDQNYTVQITGEGYAGDVMEYVEKPPKDIGKERGITVLISADHMGRGSEELGKILMKGFVFSLTELSPVPEAVLFINSGIYLTVESANTLEDLKTLEEKGTKIRSCGTCLNYYNQTEKLAVGEVIDMFGITGMLAEAEKVVTL